MCETCNDTGMKYEGNGHRMSGYPYAEMHTAVVCGCPLGRAIDGYGTKWPLPMPPEREVTEAEIAKSEARKANFTKRADAYVAKVSREMDVLRAKPGYKEPLWFIEQQRQIGETT